MDDMIFLFKVRFDGGAVVSFYGNKEYVLRYSDDEPRKIGIWRVQDGVVQVFAEDRVRWYAHGEEVQKAYQSFVAQLVVT